MSLIGRISSIEHRGKVTDEKMWNPSLWNFVGSQSTAGENINEYTSLTYSAVFNAVTLISGSLGGSTPLNLMQQSGKKRVPALKHPLYRIMHSRANPLMTAMALRETMIAHVLLWGNAYAEIVRNGLGEIVQLWPISPNRVNFFIGEDTQIYYEITVDSQKVTLPRDRILHVPGLGFDGFQGYSVVTMARQSFGLGKAMETFGSLFFSQGTHPGVIISHPGTAGISEQAHKNLRDQLMTTYGGLGKTHRLMLLEEGMKIEKLGISNEDSQFLESRAFQIPEVARWFNLPPHKLKDLTKSSFNNIESEQSSFVIDGLLPWGIRFEQNYNMQLLTDKEQQSGLYFKHNFEGLLRGNSKDRAELYKMLWLNGMITENEVREKEELNPSDNPLADELFVPLNMIPLSMIEKYFDAKLKISPDANQNELLKTPTLASISQLQRQTNDK